MATDPLDLARYGRLRAAGMPHTEAMAAATKAKGAPAKPPPVIRAPTDRERVIGALQNLMERTLPAPPPAEAPRPRPSTAPAVLRAATPTERVQGRVRDLIGALATGVGTLTDPLGLTGFAGLERSYSDPEPQVQMGMPGPPEGRLAAEALTGLVKGAPRGGFYSRVDDAVRLLPAKGAHPNKVASLLKSNASAEELAHRQVPEFLAGKGNAPVTPGALQAHLAAHPAPVPTVVTRGGPRPEADALAQQWQASMDATNHAWQQWQEARTMGAAPEAVDAARARWQALNAETDRLSQGWETASPKAFETKYGNYTVPGGEAYRETLLTLPQQGEDGFQRLIAQRDDVDRAIRAAQQGDRFASPPPELREQYNRLQRQIDAMQEQQFKSGHFDEPNIVVHTRANERTLPTGERGRFLEEVQSDWHQQGKKKGYALPSEVTAPMDAEYRALVHKNAAAREAGQQPLPADVARAQELEAALLRSDASKIPDAPFKETWPDLGLKQQLLETAADPNAQWLGFTSGQTQAARYDLSKQISRVEFDAGDRQLRAFDHAGREVLSQTTGPEHLPDYIGKEAAEKLLASTPSLHPDDRTPLYSLSGVDLQVGGEGMKHFYDDLLPKRLEKILKPFGGTVTPMTARETGNADLVGSWIARLTPEMKARIMKEGLPLLTLPLAALLGAAAAPSTPRDLEAR